jgi:hypothetical protein
MTPGLSKQVGIATDHEPAEPNLETLQPERNNP